MGGMGGGNGIEAIWEASTWESTVASGERSFSKLKLIKNYLRSTMTQERLTGLAILAIEQDIASSLSYDDIISDFAEKKAVNE
jgi:hypothetical protein